MTEGPMSDAEFDAWQKLNRHVNLVREHTQLVIKHIKAEPEKAEISLLKALGNHKKLRENLGAINLAGLDKKTFPVDAVKEARIEWPVMQERLKELLALLETRATIDREASPAQAILQAQAKELVKQEHIGELLALLEEETDKEGIHAKVSEYIEEGVSKLADSLAALERNANSIAEHPRRQAYAMENARRMTERLARRNERA